MLIHRYADGLSYETTVHYAPEQPDGWRWGYSVDAIGPDGRRAVDAETGIATRGQALREARQARKVDHDREAEAALARKGGS